MHSSCIGYLTASDAQLSCALLLCFYCCMHYNSMEDILHARHVFRGTHVNEQFEKEYHTKSPVIVLARPGSIQQYNHMPIWCETQLNNFQ